MTNYYQILTQSLSICSDDPLFLKAFFDDYQWFEVEDHKNVDMPVGLFDNHLYINGRVIDLSGHPTPGHVAFQLIVSEIMSRLNKNFYLIHAGVLKRDNELIVLSGPSGIGKSTLVKMLVSNQFDYFSDDCAPLHKNTGKIYPFPRSMWIVDNQSSSNVIRKKKMLTIHSQCKACLDPIKPTIIICLIDDVSHTQWVKLNLSLKSTDNHLIDALEKIPNLSLSKRDPVYPEYRMCYPVASDETRKAIQRVVNQYNQHLWTIYRVPPLRQCFTRQASIMPVTAHKAASNIITEMKMLEPVMTKSKNGSLMTALMEISGHIQGASCYYLFTGHLDSEVDCINKVCR